MSDSNYTIVSADGAVGSGSGVLRGLSVTATSSGVFQILNGSGGDVVYQSKATTVQGDIHEFPDVFLSAGIYFELVSGTATVVVYHSG